MTTLNSRSRTNWEALERKTDEQIDTSEIAPLGDEFFQDAQWQLPAQELLVLPVDAEVLAWFKAHNGDFKTRVEAASRAYRDANQIE